MSPTKTADGEKPLDIPKTKTKNTTTDSGSPKTKDDEDGDEPTATEIVDVVDDDDRRLNPLPIPTPNPLPNPLPNPSNLSPITPPRTLRPPSCTIDLSSDIAIAGLEITITIVPGPDVSLITYGNEALEARQHIFTEIIDDTKTFTATAANENGEEAVCQAVVTVVELPGLDYTFPPSNAGRG